jgi:subtilisin family serine protease
MAPPKFLGFTDGTYRRTTIRYRKEHLIIKFKQYEFHTAKATRLLDSILGSGNYQIVGAPIGRWTYLWIDVHQNKLLAIVEGLNQHQDVEFAEPDLSIVPSATPKDPMLKINHPFEQWGPEYMGMFSAWDIQTGTTDVVIGLLDSGVPMREEPAAELAPHASLDGYIEHEDLDGKRFLAGKDFVNDQRVWPRDDYVTNFHGTQMAGIIAAKADNTDDSGAFLGTAGINWGSPVYAYKAEHQSFGDLPEDSELRSSVALFFLGIKEVLTFAEMSELHKKVVLNVSAVFENDIPEGISGGTMADIFDLVMEKDAIICLGAGNKHNDIMNPAKYGSSPERSYASNVVVVGAVNKHDFCSGSMAHKFSDMVYAPGEDVGTTRFPTPYEPDKYYIVDGGTSHATAHVSALVAVMWSEAPHLSAAEIVDVLKSTCRRIPEDDHELMASFGNKPGHGIVQAHEALQKLKTRICLVLDRSGSMTRAAGIGGKTRLEILKAAAAELVNLVDVGSSLGLVSFNETAELINAPQLIEIPKPGTGATDDRTALINSIDSLTAGGSTSIGAGVVKARSALDAESPPQAVIVLTDGDENHTPYLSTLPGGPGEIPVFAVGLGTADSLQPEGLMTITEKTDGYVLLDDQFATGDSQTLTKFLGQIINEISGAEQATDPAGTIQPGHEQDFTVLLGDADTSAEIFLVRPPHAPLEIQVRAPAGGDSLPETRTWTSGDGRITRCRFSLPGSYLKEAADYFGEWRIILSLSEDAFASWVNDGEGMGSMRTTYSQEGLPYTIWVSTRSRLKMHCRVKQSGFTPGSTMTLHARLTEDGKSVPWPEVPAVSVVGPDEKPIEPEIDNSHDNRIEYTITAREPGIYLWNIVARGSEESGRVFQRERRLTGAVWNPRPAWGLVPIRLAGPVRTTLFLNGGWVAPTRPERQA